MPGRKRNVHLHVMVTEDELAAIHARMAEAGISNTGASVRKMALNGYILHVDLAPVKELVSLQRRCSNNLNQVAVHANTYGVYPEEIDGLRRDYEKLWGRWRRSCGNSLRWWQNKKEGAAVNKRLLLPLFICLRYQ